MKRKYKVRIGENEYELEEDIQHYYSKKEKEEQEK